MYQLTVGFYCQQSRLHLDYLVCGRHVEWCIHRGEMKRAPGGWCACAGSSSPAGLTCAAPAHHGNQLSAGQTHPVQT